MKAKPGKMITAYLVLLALIVPVSSYGQARQAGAGSTGDTAKVVFDMRDGIPKIAAVHMQLIHDTYDQLLDATRKPALTVVFIASAVKLLSSDQSGFSPEDRQYLEQIDETITRLVEDGVDLEVCLAAVDFFHVDPASIRPEIKLVKNGWISLLDYQEEGFRLIPVY